MTPKKKRVIVNSIFYSLIVLIYGFVIFIIVTKVNDGTVYIFDTRFDVVLTDSMSEKNEEHLDFLEGTQQIQPFDVVKSHKIKDDTEINIKDVVLFSNPDLNNATVMHRIVGVQEIGDELTVYDGQKETLGNINGIDLKLYSGGIYLSPLDITSIQIEYISNSSCDNNYIVTVDGKTIESTVRSEEYGDYFKYNATYERTSTYPTKISINKGKDVESNITKVTYQMASGNLIEFDSSEYAEQEEPYKKLYNSYFLYEIRGDKAKDSDGFFKRDKLISKVNGVTPKAGYAIRFFTSIPGVIMFVGLAFIITIASYFYNRNTHSNVTVEEKGEKNEQE